jgi:hypothetical protein
MKAWDFDAVTHDGAVYCIGCCPVSLDDEEVHPIFASDECDYAPTCDVCGEIHDYMGFTEEHYRREAEREAE